MILLTITETKLPPTRNKGERNRHFLRDNGALTHPLISGWGVAGPWLDPHQKLGAKKSFKMFLRRNSNTFFLVAKTKNLGFCSFHFFPALSFGQTFEFREICLPPNSSNEMLCPQPPHPFFPRSHKGCTSYTVATKLRKSINYQPANWSPMLKIASAFLVPSPHYWSNQPTNCPIAPHTNDTPPKFNMEPENNGFQLDFPFPVTYFQVPY